MGGRIPRKSVYCGWGYKIRGCGVGWLGNPRKLSPIVAEWVAVVLRDREIGSLHLEPRARGGVLLGGDEEAKLDT